MGELKRTADALILKKQLKEIARKYYALWDEIDNMRSNLRVHFSAIVAAFLGIIVSLHQTSSNTCLEWCFFICVALCTVSLVCLLISSFENLHNSIALRDIVKAACDKAIDTITPMENLSFVSPRRKVYCVLFWFGITAFCFAIILFCLLSIPI